MKGSGEARTIREYKYDSHGKIAEVKEYPGFEKGKSVCIKKAYTYDNLDRVISVIYKCGNEIPESYQYDKNNYITGNQRTVVNEYDADNRLSKVTLVSVDKSKGQNEQVIQENLYNGNGQRVRKCEGEKKTNYFYQDGIVSYTTEDVKGNSSLKNEICYTGGIYDAATELYYLKL